MSSVQDTAAQTETALIDLLEGYLESKFPGGGG